VALGCAYAGGWAWTVLVALVAMVLAWEWDGLCAHRPAVRPDLPGWVCIAVVTAGVAAGGWPGARAGLALLVAGALATSLAAAMARAPNALWRGAGVLYVGVPCLAIVWLRNESQFGWTGLLWLLLVVWTTDVAAYAVGRAIGGPKLAPQISPGKTWAGLVGGIAAAAVVGALIGLYVRPRDFGLLVAASALLAVIEQLGDLVESAIKRRFGVKDSSAIIPGHGGFLDRVDGLMAVAVAVAGLTLAGRGDILPW
jgi:phosphatidate cytidylyltransferase